MRIKTETIVCDICKKEIGSVAGTTMYSPAFIESQTVHEAGYQKVYSDICGHCSDAIVDTIEGLKP